MKKIVAICMAILTIQISLGFLMNPILAQETEDVVVTATVSGCDLTILIHPEKRIPQVGNWGTDLEVDIYRSSDNLYMGSFNTTSNDLLGQTPKVNLCGLGIVLDSSNYDLYINGKSHLRRKYSNISNFNTPDNVVDLRLRGLLLAGDVSNILDNYINILDISVILSGFLGNQDKIDLNQDGKVNVLDLSNVITNYLTKGD
ncbi:MAG: hypothetical protein Q9M91_00335 [Candidatus Dojkabacteria bacterium]|nr:hypothetical protein [Candidatus Dojkabacteria bacterium]MDQ7020279.1 hypothetical protein [Candidatus Dojkabacteria bacterium]